MTSVGPSKFFLEFIRSGFISEHYYLAIKANEGRYGLPAELVKQVLIRAGRTYFEEEGSFLANLFQASESSGANGNILRAVILLTLDQMRSNMKRSYGTAFVPFRELIGIICSSGYEEQLVLDEINTLLDRGLIIADHQRKSIRTAEDRIRISPSGLVHIRLLGDLVYVGLAPKMHLLSRTAPLIESLTGYDEAEHRRTIYRP